MEQKTVTFKIRITYNKKSEIEEPAGIEDIKSFIEDIVAYPGIDDVEILEELEEN